MEFEDLNDEIIADDWLIPAKEISRKKLIRRTPRHNIYKADWFGEVLVYEPVNDRGRTERESIDFKGKNFIFHQEELNSKLNSFRMQCNERTENKQQPLSTYLLDVGEQQTDSAYSSISSSPQYDTKNTRCEFEFPVHNKLDSSPSLQATTTLCGPNKIENFSEQVKGDTKTMVILNKDSFVFEKSMLSEEDECESENFFDSSRQTKSMINYGNPDWFELNELRLVAHESFMLFMGASIVEKTVVEETFRGSKEQSTSLVMQMNHPKAISLYNLLHANKFKATPILDRFSKFKQSSYQPLSVEAKLNICQQITNAMTYLHDKQIVHGKLTSVNIYIEFNQRVKISLIDNSDEPIATSCTSYSNNTKTSGNCSFTNNKAKFNLPALTYLSPELVRSIEIKKLNHLKQNGNCETRVKIDTNQLSKSSDIFSFGTLLYELFEERFPFSTQNQNKTNNSMGERLLSPPVTGIGFSPLDSTLDSMLTHWNGNIEATASELIFKIGSGNIESNLKDLNHNTQQLVQSIISACWCQDPKQRPQFKQFCFA